MKHLIFSLIIFFTVFLNQNAQTKVEKWDFFEITLEVKISGNPFLDTKLKAVFYNKTDTFLVSGFYDGEDMYKIRFMPQKEGKWNYVTQSNNKSLNNIKDSFACVPPALANHGPVRVNNTFCFSYADGTAFYPLGTTAYGWIQQNEETTKQTLESLKNSPFNKIRFVILPHAPSGKEYEIYPYEGEGKEWNFKRFNPEYFRKYEKYILELRNLGIQADVILFHPYDKGVWGFDKMDKEEQYLYLNYVNARFGAFRNIWWSMANEFDLMTNRSMNDWDGYFQFFVENDPYKHLRSNHNAAVWYDHSKSWVTHASIQSESWWMAKSLRKKYQKPVIFDEFCYEGDGDSRIIALNGEAICHRFWLMTVLGTYGTHGDGFYQPNTKHQFFRQGGFFVGESVKMLKTLRNLLDSVPGHLEPMGWDWRLNWIMAGIPNEYYLYYLGEYQNASWAFTELPQKLEFNAEIINTRTGEIIKSKKTFKKNDVIDLPGKPYHAIVLRVMK